MHIENQEIELKLHLQTEEDYQKLLTFSQEDRVEILQTNIFYDTPAREVSSIGYALRLRLQSDHGVITLKSTTKQVSDASVRMEIEEKIPYEKAMHIMQRGNIKNLDSAPIRKLKDQKINLELLSPLLQFKNYRVKKNVELNNKTYLFELDKTTYSDDTTIYELEIELKSQNEINSAVADIQKLFQILDIEFIVMKKSKFERALEIAGLL